MARRRTPEEPAPVDVDPPAPKPTGKGRPTPKRRDAEKRRTGPIQPPPTSRREASRRMRADNKERRTLARKALRSGDERYLPARDQGTERRLVRNIVDSRRNVATLFIPVALLYFLFNLSRVVVLQTLSFLLWVVFLFLFIADALVLARQIRRAVLERFPDTSERMRSLVFYGVVRATALRRLRQPAPQVRPGDKI